jgi:hypothetical protein
MKGRSTASQFRVTTDVTRHQVKHRYQWGVKPASPATDCKIGNPDGAAIRSMLSSIRF